MCAALASGITEKKEFAADRLVRLPEVKFRLGMSKSSIYNMIKKGEFPPPCKHGLSSFWSEADVDAKVEEIKRNTSAVRQTVR